MDLIIDNREQERVSSSLIFFNDPEVDVTNVSVANLSIGDYLFSNSFGECVFEYKTTEDFFNSIEDKRLFNQAINQYNNYLHQFIIIVGTDKEKTNVLSDTYKKSKWYGKGQVMTNNHYYGAITRLNTYSTVLFAPNEKTAFGLMLMQAEKCLNDDLQVKKFNKSIGSPAFRFLCYCIDGVGESTSKLICKKLNLTSYNDLLGLTEEALLSIKGVGPKTCKKILSGVHG